MRVVEHQNAHTKVIVMAATPYHHKSLRHRNVNYQSGCWSVSIQVAKNKSIFGAIVGDRVVLNALGGCRWSMAMFRSVRLQPHKRRFDEYV